MPHVRARVTALEGQVSALEADYSAFKRETINVVNGLLSRFGGVTDVGGAIDSATEDLQSFFNSTIKEVENDGAGEGNRTPVASLGS